MLALWCLLFCSCYGGRQLSEYYMPLKILLILGGSGLWTQWAIDLLRFSRHGECLLTQIEHITAEACRLFLSVWLPARIFYGPSPIVYAQAQKRVSRHRLFCWRSLRLVRWHRRLDGCWLRALGSVGRLCRDGGSPGRWSATCANP